MIVKNNGEVWQSMCLNLTSKGQEDCFPIKNRMFKMNSFN